MIISPGRKTRPGSGFCRVIIFRCLPACAGLLAASIGLADPKTSPEQQAAQSDVAATVGSQEARGEGELAEIVVTATHRSANLEDVPISIAAISADDIARLNLVSQTDFLRTLPGVSQLENGAGQSFLVVRGITASPSQDGYGSGLTTEVLLGEVPLSTGRIGQPDLRLVDIDRVEVLRGPQGTDFGSGSLSGAIRYIPKAPDLSKFEGRVDAGYSYTGELGGGNNDVDAVVNIPIIDDKLGLRAVAYRYFDSGYVRNIAASDPAFVARATALGVPQLLSDGREGDAYVTGGRTALLWKPTENASITLTALEETLEQYGTLEVQTNAVPGYYDALPGPYDQTRYSFTNTPVGGADLLSDRFAVGNILFQYNLGWGELLNSLSYVDTVFNKKYDLGPEFIGLYSNNSPAPQSLFNTTHATIDELRFTSHFSGPLGLIAGLYYEDTKNNLYGTNTWGGTLAALYVTCPLCRNRITSTFRTPNDTIQRAAYGEVSYQATKSLKLTLGGRSFRYDKEISQVLAGGIFGGNDISTYSASVESRHVYKANLSYQPVEHSLFYAEWSQGFRLGFPQIPLTPNCLNNNGVIIGVPGNLTNADIALVKSDSVNNYELGAKLRFLDSRAEVNLAIYDIEWKDIPVTLFPTCLSTFEINAGKARSRGAELETKYALSSALTVSASGAYTDPFLSAFASGVGNAGDRLPGSPRYTARLALDYALTLGGLPAFIQADVSRVGNFYSEVAQQGPVLGRYTDVGTRAGVTWRDFDLTLYVKNLTDSRGTVWYTPGLNNSNVLRPITGGIKLGYRF
jgi:iron complex outermembrane recepter protein